MSNKYIVQTNNDAVQMLLKDKPLGNNTEVNDVVCTTPLAATGKLISRQRKDQTEKQAPTWKAK